MDEPERRALLRSLAGGVAASATLGLAGCSDAAFLDPGGGSADGSYLFEPGTVADSDHYDVRFAAPDVVSAYDDDLPEATVGDVENRAAWLYDATDTEFEAATAQLTFRTVVVAELDHDPETVEDELEDGDYEEDSDDEQGYRVFRSEGGGRAVGFDGTTLVGAEPVGEEPDPADVVEEVVETEAGGVDRYGETNEAFAAVTDELNGDVFVARSHEETDDTDPVRGLFQDEVARGLTASLGEADTDVRVVLAFEEEDDVVLDDVASWTETAAFDSWDGVSVDATGAIVAVTATVDTGAFELTFPRGSPAESPLDWVPSPAALGASDGVSIRRSEPETLAGMEYLPDDFRENVASGLTQSLFDLEPPVLERITFGPIEVVRTGLDEETLSDRITGDDLERRTGYAGFTLYEDPTPSSRAAAVDGGTLVVGREWDDAPATEVVTTTIDAVGGDAERYVETYDPLAEVDARIDVGPVTIYRPDRAERFDGAQASGVQFEFGSERTALTIPFVFEDADAAEAADLERSYASEFDDFGTRRDGRVAVVTGTVETDELA